MLSNEYRSEQIASYYHNFLGRIGSTAEIAGWAASSLDLQQIQQGFLSSPEFYNRTVASPLIAALAFVAPAQVLTTGNASQPITIVLLDASLNPVNAGAGGVVVNLSSTSAQGSFVNSKGVAATSVVIAAGTDTATFTYKDLTPGKPILTISGTGLFPATQQETELQAVPTKLNLTTAGQVLTAGVARARSR